MSFISRVATRLMVCAGLCLMVSSLPGALLAHPMPNSVVLLDIGTDAVAVELQLPLSELQLALGYDTAQTPAALVNRLGPKLRAYLLAHVRPVSPDGRRWTVAVRSLAVQSTTQTAAVGIAPTPYQELTAHLVLTPPPGAPARTFTLRYDVIVHQVVTHSALVSIRQDWEAARFGEQVAEVGVIQVDVPTNTIPPLTINRASGSLWRGFRGMVNLGTRHIAEGTDHLLFVLVLLLPAPLLVAGRRWGGFGGVRYSLSRLLWVVTAFTLGHSLTLLAGAAGWVRLPAQPVEILIAVSIVVSAIHALRPLFPGREAGIAALVGLVHGLAFAGTLANLTLDAGRMALSILGFNLGIELMQLAVIALTVPWLMLLSRTPAYTPVRVAVAMLAGIVALAWLAERITGQPNAVTGLVTTATPYAPYLAGLLAVGSLLSIGWAKRKASGPVAI